MAASTWFHGSACPPGNQGIMPFGSCHSAMRSTVTATWWADKMPGTSGSSIASDMAQLLRAPLARRSGVPRRASGLVGVDDEALSEHGTEEAVRDAGHGRMLLDVPDQEPVVGAGQRVIVVAGADRALQPPVRGVQAVLEVGGAGLEARAPHLRAHLGLGVDPHVTAHGLGR